MKKNTIIYTLIHIIVPVYFYSILTNYIWEMFQMPLFEGLSIKELRSWLTCLAATFGDANIILFIWFCGLLIYKDIWWICKITVPRVLLVVSMGFLITWVFELYAISSGRWAYSSAMPVIPFINIGLSPVLQMTILPPFLLFIIIRRIKMDSVEF